jgi:UDP-glucose 4-epimerase
VGGLGFVGAYVIRELAKSHDLFVLTDVVGLERYRNFVEELRLPVKAGDIRDVGFVNETFREEKPDATVHLAALTGLAKCNDDPSLAFMINVFGTRNVVMGCVEQESKMIFMSSREVYGETRSERTKEDDPLIPNNVYGLTKMLGEALVLWASKRYGLDYTILRLTNVYGPEGDQYNIQAMIRNAFAHGVIPIMGGDQTMNFLYVEDVATVVRKCLEERRASSQIFNVGSNDDRTIEETVNLLVSSLPIKVRLERRPMRSGETLSFRPDLTKIQATLAYTPTPLMEGLRKTVMWYQQRLASLQK